MGKTFRLANGIATGVLPPHVARHWKKVPSFPAQSFIIWHVRSLIEASLCGTGDFVVAHFLGQMRTAVRAQNLASEDMALMDGKRMQNLRVKKPATI